MFGIGAQEMVLIGLLCLLVFGPARISGMARELGGFVRKARETADEFKAGLELDAGQEEGSWEDPKEYPGDPAADDRRGRAGGEPALPEDGAYRADRGPEEREGAPEGDGDHGGVPGPKEGPRPRRDAMAHGEDAGDEKAAPEPAGGA